jgi:hypothetical protein
MASKPPDAFLSYTRFDDEYHGGAISAFREQLSMAVRAVTAKPFEVFQDVGGIGLGENWPKRLNIVLGEARFFIPILTPSYFESNACRAELQTFLEFENESGRDDLILPIYWLRCRVLEDPNLRTRDALAEIIHDRQRWPWQKFRNKPYSDPEVRAALEELAERIEEARMRTGEPASERAEAGGARPKKQQRARTQGAQRRPGGKPAESRAKETHWSELEYHDPELAGRITLNYSNNNGRYSIGRDEFFLRPNGAKRVIDRFTSTMIHHQLWALLKHRSFIAIRT